MRSERYKKFYGALLEEGRIPQELYDAVINEIDDAGKLDRAVYARILERFEQYRAFDIPTVPYSTKKAARTDGTYKYPHQKNVFWHIGHAITATIYKFIGWLGSGIVYGMWHFPRKYAKKFKGVKGCITVSNHIGYIDACLTRRALGMRKQCIVAAPYNCKRTLGGAILSSAIVLPLPSTFRGTKSFNEALEHQVKKGAAIHFYAEQNMWIRYRKIRPYMSGAFFYADKLDVPIVPMLYCIKDSKGLRKLFGLPKATVRVADPVYPDKTLSPRARREDMEQRVKEATLNMYEEFYGHPLEYLPEAKKPADNSGEKA